MGIRIIRRTLVTFIRPPPPPPPAIVTSRTRVALVGGGVGKAQRIALTGRLTKCCRRSMSTTTAAVGDTSAAEAEEVIVQYVVLRRDLIETWPMGSVVTQGCHASVAAIWEHKEDPHTLLYCSPPNLPSMHKVTLEVKGEAQIVNLSEKLTANGILHKLWIEQPENFPTCLATKPFPKSLVSPFFKKLKLCK